MNNKKKIVRIANIPSTIDVFCRGILNKMSKDYDVIVIASPGPQMKTIEERENVRTIAIPIERPISVFKDIKSLIRIIRVFRKEKPDMVHGVVGGKGSFLAMVAGRLTGVPFRVYTFTGTGGVYRTGLLGMIMRTVCKISCSCATHLIAEGVGVKSDMEKAHVTTKEFRILGNGNIRGIDSEYYNRTEPVVNAAKEIKQTIGGSFAFVFVGRIVADKGINELVSAFSKLYDTDPSVRLILVGGYDDGLNPISTKTKKEIEDNPAIFAVGIQNDVRPYLVASDCFVLPSYREGVPNSPLEAGAMGVPSIVTDINGSREIIQNGETGIIIPAMDETALYNAMLYMRTHPEDREKMASHSRTSVISRYEQSIVHNCLLDFYKELFNDTNVTNTRF